MSIVFAVLVLVSSSLGLAAGFTPAESRGRDAAYVLQDAGTQGQESEFRPSTGDTGGGTELTGRLTVIWGDGRDGTSRMTYMLSSDDGRNVELAADETVFRQMGGILSLNGQRIKVVGQASRQQVAGAALEPLRVSVASVESLSPQDSALAKPAVEGNQPWISLLCKFADVPDEPKPLAYYRDMYGNSWPGLNHYWRELSYDTINLDGSQAWGWYTLPEPRSHYVYDADGDGHDNFDAWKAANACVAVADPDVYFPAFKGINLMFNAELDGSAWGGASGIVADGQERLIPTTWIPNWNYDGFGLIEHEMGHGFGLPHSSGMYGQVYDNVWDIMSFVRGQHTIAYHKALAGWIPAGQRYLATAFRQTITLEQLALPQSDNYKVAQIPIRGSQTRFYTVEARRRVGYDVVLPGEAVIIHEVDPYARVIDADGNGNTGDEGAMWTVGETFTDAANDISVSVDSATSTGFVITIVQKPAPALLTPSNDRTLLPGIVEFRWSAIVGATGYEIQIDTVPTFNSAGLITHTETGTSYSRSLASLGDRYWRVRALPNGLWPDAERFRVAEAMVQVTTDQTYDYSPALVQVADGKLLTVFTRDDPSLWSRVSTDGGATWGSEMQIDGCCRNQPNASLASASDGTLWLAYQRDGDIWYRTSATYGATWTAEIQLTTHAADDYDPAVLQAADHKLWIVWSSSRSGNPDLWYKTSADGGTTWSADTQLTTDSRLDDSPTIAQAADGKLWVVWLRVGYISWLGCGDGIWYRTTADGGASWSSETQLTARWGAHPSLVAASDGDLWLAIGNGDLWLRTSADNGATWSDERRFTRFAGPDWEPTLAPLAGGKIAVAWRSHHSGSWTSIWFGIPGEREDSNPPPYVAQPQHQPAPNPYHSDTITFRARALDETGLTSVSLVWTLNGVAQPDLPLYDDGAHGDDTAGDGTYGARMAPLPAGSQVTYHIRATDTDGNTAASYQLSFQVITPFVRTTDLLFVPDSGEYDSTWFRPYFTNALDALGYRYDIWNTQLRGLVPASILSQYSGGGVIWSIPAPWGYLIDNFSDQRTALQSYLAGGGKLFISGQNVAETLPWTFYSGTDFLHNYLHASFVQGDTGLYALSGAAGDPIGGVLALNLSGGDGFNNQFSKDEVDPIAPAQAVLTYQAGAAAMLAEPRQPATPRDATAGGEPGGAASANTAVETNGPWAAGPMANISSGTAGLRVDTGVYKVVYFAFGFEAINSAADRTEVMRRVLDWLGVCAAPAVPGNPKITKDGNDVVLNWTAVSADSYEVWHSSSAPFFTPGDACSGPACVSVTTNTYRYIGAMADGYNHYYLVRAVQGCGAKSEPSKRIGKLDFSLVPSSP